MRTKFHLVLNAPVDREVASLVTALSLFPKLQTIESCQNIRGSAWVTFVYGNVDFENRWQELAEFVFGSLAPRLVVELGDRITIGVHITEAGLYRAEMTVNIEAIPATVDLVRKLSSEI